MIIGALALNDDKFIKYDDNPRDYRMPEFHYHNYYEIYFLVEGKCTFSVENHIFNLRKNHMLIIPPGLVHRADAYPQLSKRIVLNFAKSCVSDDFKKLLAGFRKQNLYIPKDSSQILNIFSNIRKNHFCDDAVSQEMSYCYLTLLLEYITRSESSPLASNQQNFSVQLVENIMKYIADTYYDDISVTQLSKQFGYSPNYISSLFKKVSGTGLKNYIILQRLKNAEYMLATTDKSISEIAFRSGFNDSNYFSTLFKKFHNISPRKYRLLHQSD